MPQNLKSEGSFVTFQFPPYATPYSPCILSQTHTHAVMSVRVGSKRPLEEPSNDANAPPAPSRIVGLFLVRNDGFLVAIRSFGYRGTRIEISSSSDLTTKKVSRTIEGLRECTVAVHAAKANTERIWLMCEDDGVYTLDIAPMLEAFKDTQCTLLEFQQELLVPFGRSWRSSMRRGLWSIRDRYLGMTISEDGSQLALMMNVSHNVRLIIIDVVPQTLVHEGGIGVVRDGLANMQFSSDKTKLIVNMIDNFLLIMIKDADGTWLQLQLEEFTCFDIAHHSNIYACGAQCKVEWGDKYLTESINCRDSNYNGVIHHYMNPHTKDYKLVEMHDLVFTHDDRYVVVFFAHKSTAQLYQHVVELKTGNVVRRLTMMENTELDEHKKKRLRYGAVPWFFREVPSHPVFDSKGRTLFVALPNEKTFAKEDLYESRAVVWVMLLNRINKCVLWDNHLYKYILSFVRCWFIIEDNV